MTFFVNPGRDLPGVLAKSGRSPANVKLEKKANALAMKTIWTRFNGQTPRFDTENRSADDRSCGDRDAIKHEARPRTEALGQPWPMLGIGRLHLKHDNL